MRVLDFDRRIIRRHSNRIEELWLRKLNFACVFELASRRLAGDSLGDVQHVWTPVATTGTVGYFGFFQSWTKTRHKMPKECNVCLLDGLQLYCRLNSRC